MECDKDRDENTETIFVIKQESLDIYCCGICPEVCEDDVTYSEHILSHTKAAYVHLNKQVIYECALCGAAFVERQLYFTHQLKHIRDKMQKNASHCGDKFNEDSWSARCDTVVCQIKEEKDDSDHEHCEEKANVQLNNYVDSNTINTEYKNSEVGIHLQHLSALRHQQDIKLENYEQCDDSSTHNTLKKHEKGQYLPTRNVNNQKLTQQDIKCSFCDKHFTKLSYLIKHECLHSDIKPQACEYCGKYYTQPSVLKQHELTHTAVKPHKCHYCDKRFTRVSHLNAHVLTHKGIKPHKCGYCDKSFTTSSSCRTHEDRHRDVRAHKCPRCDKSFSQLSCLKIHELKHAGIKPYKCQYCDKCFTTGSHLNAHEYLHTGIKPYKCHFCDKSFARKKQLTRHEFVHKDKPYKCQHCDKSFLEAYGLKVHELSHAGFKPHKCQHCDKAFTYSFSLKEHQIVHADSEKPHKCPRCPKRFSRLRSLKRHALVHTKRETTNVNTERNTSHESSNSKFS